MDNEIKTFLIPANYGRSGLLRIPESLVSEFPGKDSITPRINTPDGQELPVHMNFKERILTGLDTWLRTIREQEFSSFRITIEQRDPPQLSITLSNETLGAEQRESLRIERPTEGLYLGRCLENRFYELLPTTNPFSLSESDLLTHIFICGATGAGKTVLGKAFLEEAALKGIPSIAIDLKGDISSLALMFSGEDPGEIEPWIAGTRDRPREEVISDKARKHRRNLADWGIDPSFVRDAKSKFLVNIFTPRSNNGFRLALSAFPEPPENIEQMREEDPDSYDSMVDFLAEQFVSRLRINKNLLDKAKAYVFEIVRTCHMRSISMKGYEGVKRVLDEVRDPALGIDQIGGMPTEDYISAKDRKALADAVNALLTGAARRLYEGWPLNIHSLIDPQFAGGCTPVSIINVSGLEFSDQAYVIGYVAYLISFWMKRFPGTGEPRLIFYIDEIGGGGGRAAFFPSVAKSPCKEALNFLLRRGRAYGVCCIFATQNPGDIDYKGLSNCGSWMVGQLRTQRDRAKIEQGASTAELEFESARGYMASLACAQFLVNTPSKTWSFAQERWLLSLHKIMSDDELKRYKRKYEDSARSAMSEAEKCLERGRLSEASGLFRGVAMNYPFSSLTASALLRLATVLLQQKQYEEAETELQQLLERWIESDDLAEAKFLLGRCYEHRKDFVRARDTFREAGDLTRQEELKKRSKIYEEYCESNVTWPTLSALKKLVWWVVGRMPEEGALVQLEVKDEEILTRTYRSVLANVDFSLPPMLEYVAPSQIEESTDSTEKEIDTARARIERWAQDQVPKIEEFLKSGRLTEAAEHCRRVVQRLNDANAIAASSVLDVLAEVDKKAKIREQDLRSRVTQVEARQFEYEVARLFSLHGYKAYATQATADDGVDVFAWKGSEKVVVQCKRWKSKPVGRNVVDELKGTMSRHSTNRAVLATTSWFSEAGARAAQQHGIKMLDFHELCRLFKEVGETPRF